MKLNDLIIKRLKFSPLLIAILASSNLFALDDDNSLSTNASAFKDLSGFISVSGSRNAYDSSATNSYQGYGLSGAIMYQTDIGRFKTALSWSHEMDHEEYKYFNEDNTSISDISFEYRVPSYKLAEQWSSASAISINLPTSPHSKETKLHFSTKLSTFLFYNPTKSWSFYISPQYRYYDYQYKTPVNGGTAFTEHRFDFVGDVTYRFFEDFYFDFSASYTLRRNEFGTSLHPNFSNGEELGWQFHPSWVTAIGHSNSGEVYESERGQSKHYSLGSKDGSTFYISLSKYF